MKATKRAFFLGELRRPGEVFDIADSVPLRHWMVRVPDETPTRHLGAQGALNQEMADRFGEVPTASAKAFDDAHALTEYDPLTRRW